MLKKVIIMDIDGTLLTSEKVIPEKTKKALMDAERLGAVLVLASGRPTTGILHLAKQLEMDKYHGLLVSYNGSRVTECQTMEVLFNEPLSVEEGKRVLNHMKKFQVSPMFDKGNYMFVNDVYGFMVQYESRGGNYLLCELNDLEEFLDFEVNKILTSGEPEYMKAHYKEMMEPFQDEISGMFTADFYFEFTAKGIDKAKALDTVLKERGYSQEEMIAFGDGHNDITMVQYAGTGVAMGNAVQELKDAADYITLTNEEEGIAEALYHFIPELRG